MSTLSEHRTVGEIAAEIPAAVQVFQKHQIDFCCGGKEALGAVCESRGLSTEAILAELEQAAAGRTPDTTDWTKADLSDLIDHIVSTHHEYLKLELPRLGEMAARVATRHAGRYDGIPERMQAIFEDMRAELEGHLMKEERVLFPLIGNLEAAASMGAGTGAPPSHCGSVNNPIRVMMHEHDSTGAALAELRMLTGQYTPPMDACNTFRGLYHGLKELEADLHRHIHLENNVLFPRATALEAGL